ncbi:MAG: bifunctional RNase H/acid phosphatase [Micrococcales bacterium]
MISLLIEADGGSRGNPGPAGSGTLVVDKNTGEVLVEISHFIGIATNNVAEYRALKAGIEAVAQMAVEAEIEVRMDSKLVIEQMSGGWKIKHPDMQKLAIEIHQILGGRAVKWVWVPREQNSRADALANRAMDISKDEVTWHWKNPKDLSVSASSTPTVASVVEFNNELPSSVRAPLEISQPLTTVVLVRHGRTSLTESKRISGSGGLNPGLSEQGWDDARRAADAVSKIGNSAQWKHLKPVTAVVASPIQRTLDTASVIAKQLGLEYSINPNIAEINFGDWDGLTNEEAEAKDPKLFNRWKGSWDVAPNGGETLADFDARVLAGIREITEKFAGQTVAVVAHVMPIRGFVRAALNAGIESYWRPQVSPCSVSVIRFWGLEAAEVVSFNATDHLV